MPAIINCINQNEKQLLLNLQQLLYFTEAEVRLNDVLPDVSAQVAGGSGGGGARRGGDAGAAQAGAAGAGGAQRARDPQGVCRDRQRRDHRLPAADAAPADGHCGPGVRRRLRHGGGAPGARGHDGPGARGAGVSLLQHEDPHAGENL